MIRINLLSPEKIKKPQNKIRRDEIGQALKRMADKDFSQPVQSEFAGAYGELRDNVNLVVEALRGAIEQINAGKVPVQKAPPGNVREDLIAFAEENQIPIAKDKRGEAPFSVDANLLHSSSEGKVLEDPNVEPPSYVFQRTISPEEAPDKPTVITIGFKKGDAVSVNGNPLSPANLLATLNDYGRDNGIGRLDLVENRFVGMKSRGVYETPGGTILIAAHRGIESITLDGGSMHLKDQLMPKYAELIYNGFWFSPEREMLQAAIDKSQEKVSGTVKVKLYKGNVSVIGRESPYSLYDQDLVTFEEGVQAYDHKDAAGFIKLNALRLRVLAKRDARKA